MNRVGSDERGAVSGLLVSTIALAVLLVVAAGGFIWAFIQYNDWKSNGEAKIAAAVSTAKDEQKKADNEAFAIEQNKPYLTYKGPSDMGSVEFNYPKTWAAYRSTAEGATDKFELYFQPYVVPQVKDGTTPYAMRVKVTTEPYQDVLEDYNDLVEDGEATASTLIIGKTDSFAGYEGVRVDGQLTDTINGSVAVFKVRDKTLQVFVDNKEYLSYFNDVVLKSLKFTP
ncbi:MAG: hypothetical protein Q4C83_00295 [Candidatus Saccharibacteria bacterium]|nr:hypothetical protein [Candidatus Saccharibacteria bacterium]